ncbi:BPSL0761 family protein [Hydrogenophaga sp.]|uniref:BPSL0761 family protein n=1 Tax=Hydrogenophaga sp. TaxID=1904254 RepID=UPI002FCC23D8
MTTPAERTRALRVASELLQDLVLRQDVPADLRVRAQRVLHHYPEEWQLRMMAEDWQRLGISTFGLEPEPGRPDPLDQLLTLKLRQG